MVATDKMLGQ